MLPKKNNILNKLRN